MAIWGCGSPAHAVSLLLLVVLFMQISGGSLTLTQPFRLCLLRVLLCSSQCYNLSPFQAHWGRWHCTTFLRPVCLFTVYVGSGPSPSPGEFSSHSHFYKFSRSWLLGVCRCSCLLHQACCEGFPLPPFNAQGAPLSLLCVFFGVIAYYSGFFSFFPGWGVGLSRGLCWSVPGLSVGIPHAA
jgi:hypothetical protein